MKILIVKTSAIGDVIHTFPVIEYLKRRFPTCEIDWVVEKGIVPLLETHPLISKVIPIDTKRWRKWPWFKGVSTLIGELRLKKYDLLFDLQGNFKSACVMGLARAQVKVGFDRKGLREKINLMIPAQRIAVKEGLSIRQKYLSLIQNYLSYEPLDDVNLSSSKGVELRLSDKELERLENLSNHPLMKRPLKLMIAFGSRWPNKQLPEMQLQAFLEQISLKYGPTFLFVYGNAEEERCARSLAERFENSLILGDLSFPLWQGCMRHVDGVIAMDSAALHLCATTQTPSFSLFGPSLSTVYKPIGDHHIALQGKCPYGKSFSVRCPALRTCPTGACMQNFSIDELLEGVSLMLRTFK